MAALCADVREALATSVQIARRCSLTLTLGEARLPQYPLPAGVSTAEFLRAEAARGLSARFSAALSAPPAYRRRLERELPVVCPMGLARRFPIVAGFFRVAPQPSAPLSPLR